MEERPFVVTTRSRLRGRRHVPAMFIATRQILAEMRRTSDASEVVSIIASPREFWTVSVWATRHQMQEFMRSGEHGTYMWEVGHWLESFWLMRWAPTRNERGSWHGRRLAPAPSERTAPVAGLAPAVRDRILAGIPSLRDAFGADGRPSYDAAPETRLQRELLEGATGLLIRVPCSRLWGFRRRRHLRRLRDLLLEDPHVVRAVSGVGARGGGYLLTVWHDRDSAGRVLASAWADDLAARYGEDFWACELVPENEFGHWDGLRLRDGGLFGALGPEDTA